MLALAYYSIFIVLVGLLFLAIRWVYKTNNTPGLKQTSIIYFLGLAIWVGYLHFISHSGFIYDTSLPPRFPLLVFLPVFIFMGVFFYRKRNSSIFEAIPKSWPIYFQSFRILMEVIILYTFLTGIIPIQATFQGYNFEILFALTAPFIAYFTFVKPVVSERLVILWNGIGILFLTIVVSIVISAFFFPEVWGSEKILIDSSFTQLPFLLLPAFMVPAAIFVHIFSIMQLVKSKNPKSKHLTSQISSLPSNT